MLKRLILIASLVSVLVGSMQLARLSAKSHPLDSLDWTTLGYAISPD